MCQNVESSRYVCPLPMWYHFHCLTLLQIDKCCWKKVEFCASHQIKSGADVTSSTIILNCVRLLKLPACALCSVKYEKQMNGRTHEMFAQQRDTLFCNTMLCSSYYYQMTSSELHFEQIFGLSSLFLLCQGSLSNIQGLKPHILNIKMRP